MPRLDQSTHLTVQSSTNCPHNFIKSQFLVLNGQIIISPLIVGDLNTQFSSIDRSPEQKQTERFKNGLIVQIDLTDIYRIFHANNNEYKFYTQIKKLLIE